MAVLNWLVKIRGPGRVRDPLVGLDVSDVLQQLGAFVERGVVKKEEHLAASSLPSCGGDVVQCPLATKADVVHPFTELFLCDALRERLIVLLGLHRPRRRGWRSQEGGGHPSCKDYFCVERNRCRFNKGRLVDKKQYYFRASNCTVDPPHLRYITCRTAQGYYRGGGLSCLICFKRKGETPEEGDVHEVLQDKFPDVEYFPECKVLKGFKGAIDFAVLRERLLIQIDGVYHFNKPLYKLRAYGKGQAVVDARCNATALQEGWHMLRIHKDDLEDTESLVRELRKVARDCEETAARHRVSGHSSLSFSKGFGRATTVHIGALASGGLTVYVQITPVVPVSLNMPTFPTPSMTAPM